MKLNVGNLDRVLRAALGVVVLALGYVYQSYLGLIGLIPLVTAVVGWCPMYFMFGIGTCRVKQS